MFAFIIVDLGQVRNVITASFFKLPLPGDSEGTFRSSRQAATCVSGGCLALFLEMLKVLQENCEEPIFIVVGLTQPVIEPVSTVSVANPLPTRPHQIGFKIQLSL